jgi:hypothetical protein
MVTAKTRRQRARKGLNVASSFLKQEPRSLRPWRALRTAKANFPQAPQGAQGFRLYRAGSHCLKTRSQSDLNASRVQPSIRMVKARHPYWSNHWGDLRLGMIGHSSLAIAGSHRSEPQFSLTRGRYDVEPPIWWSGGEIPHHLVKLRRSYRRRRWELGT